MPKKQKKTREAKPGELREITVLESLDRLTRRPESRLDVQRLLSGLSPKSHTYAKHLVMSGPSSISLAAKATGLSAEDVEAALQEIEKGIALIRS